MGTWLVILSLEHLQAWHRLPIEASREMYHLATAHTFALCHTQEESLAVVKLLVTAGAHINYQGQNPLSTAYKYLNILAASALLGEQNMMDVSSCMAMFDLRWVPTVL